jgi:hypothetical protein
MEAAAGLERPNIARSDATRMSQASASSNPAASAQPLTAAITGLEIRCRPRVKPPNPRSTISRTRLGVASFCRKTSRAAKLER